jgi:molybdopterin molybdotransferase
MAIEKQSLISVDTAERIILAEAITYGSELVPIDQSLNRVLAAPIMANRDFPPFDRVTMDGIAIKFESFEMGNRQFKLQSLQAAGQPQQTLLSKLDCIEVMTGATLPLNTDTVIRYEDTFIDAGKAKIIGEIKYQQNIHFKGEDRKMGTTLIPENSTIRATEIAIAASIGAANLSVKKLPKIAIITSGDELVAPGNPLQPHQIYSSNVYAISSLLSKYDINASKIHIPDSLFASEKAIESALATYDILIMSGGVSMGKKDFIPTALENLGVKKLFHKIAQTPGKPFWFGKKGTTIVFALPGNPVSTYLCMVRYVLPWLHNSLNNCKPALEYAVLSEDFSIKNSLTYFLQVKLLHQKASLLALPIKGHGSGDFANMVDTDAFMELPAFEKNDFKKGEIFPVWRF